MLEQLFGGKKVHKEETPDNLEHALNAKAEEVLAQLDFLTNEEIATLGDHLLDALRENPDTIE